MNPTQFISCLEGLLAAQDKETKLSKAIRAKLKEVSREEEWMAPYFKREYDFTPPVPIYPTIVPQTPDWDHRIIC